MDQNEEQQVERIKEFWAEHGKGIIAGAVIGFGLFFGWRYYDKAQIDAANAASAGYQQVANQLQQDADNAVANAQQFINDNAGSQYAHLASLQLAQHAATNGDLATAVTALQTVATDADDSNLQALANIRLARVLLAQQQYDAALAAVQAQMPSAYQAAAAELEGDIYADQGQNEQAREAYQRALASEGESLTPALELKLNSLAAS
ncbi:putative negative regulator of RcsB-dependent stress response [Idiomarina aquatica]|uniref:Ancillary SecYEG translocon subunit n=1 Tax=Idiomarina aquatica TaxID=1327752 RepID=A0A4R6PSR2_9GAMM|nr:tetratricopeptide repeat protein [Idiomarina aquatica]TDP40157.1 putative negative regulator of RcsB-dependent stress response [Idiomarina aquatica]